MKPLRCAAAFIPALLLVSSNAFAQDNTARNLAANCSTCHGTQGNSAGGVPPPLAGRDRKELLEMMKAFKAGTRPSTIMHQHASGYSDRELELIAGFYAAQTPAPARVPSKL